MEGFLRNSQHQTKDFTSVEDSLCNLRVIFDLVVQVQRELFSFFASYETCWLLWRRIPPPPSGGPPPFSREAHLYLGSLEKGAGSRRLTEGFFCVTETLTKDFTEPLHRLTAVPLPFQGWLFCLVNFRQQNSPGGVYRRLLPP